MLFDAAIAQLGERQTEDLKVPGSIPGLGICLSLVNLGLFVSPYSFSPANVGPSPREDAFHRYGGLL